MAIVWALPHWVIRWAVVRAYAAAWRKAEDKVPDDLTYTEVYNAV